MMALLGTYFSCSFGFHLPRLIPSNLKSVGKRWFLSDMVRKGCEIIYRIKQFGGSVKEERGQGRQIAT